MSAAGTVGRVRGRVVETLLLGLGTLLLLIATGHQIGLTYDEPIYISRSFQVAEWLGRLLSGESVVGPEQIEQYWDARLDQQPGTIKLIFGVSSRVMGALLPVAPLTSGRLGTMLLSAVLVGVLYRAVAGFWGRAAGLVAAVGMLLMPRVWTHMHLAALDAPIMVLSFCTVLAVYAAARTGRAMWIVAAGVLFGLSLGTKLNSFFIPLIVLPWLMIIRRWRTLGWTAASLAVLGPLAVGSTWPWLWYDTWARATEYFLFHLRHYHVATTYLGQVWELAPWHYAPVMTFATTPPLLLLLAAVGVWATVRNCRSVRWVALRASEYDGAPAGVRSTVCDDVMDSRRLTESAGLPRDARPAEHDRSVGSTQMATVSNGDATYWRAAFGLLLVWGMVVNIAPSMMPWAPKYNGVRLFLPVFPYLAALAGVGFAVVSRKAIESCARRWGAQIADFPTKLRVALVLAVILPGLAAVGNSHPWGMSYYSSLIGGPSGAARLGMEPTYWGDSYLAAVGWLNRNAGQNATVWVNVAGFATSVQLYQAMGMMRHDLHVSAGVDALPEADYVVVQNKPSEMSPLMQALVARCEPLYAERLDGVPLVWVFPGDFPMIGDAPDIFGSQDTLGAWDTLGVRDTPGAWDTLGAQDALGARDILGGPDTRGA
jgi:hypothetical protein